MVTLEGRIMCKICTKLIYDRLICRGLTKVEIVRDGSSIGKNNGSVNSINVLRIF